MNHIPTPDEHESEEPLAFLLSQAAQMLRRPEHLFRLPPTSPHVAQFVRGCDEHRTKYGPRLTTKTRAIQIV